MDKIDTQKEDIYEKAIELWGKCFQVLMLAEESGELMSLAVKLSRGRHVNMIDLLREIADVEIMLEQLLVIASAHYGTTLGPMQDRLEELKQEKIMRLADRVAEVTTPKVE